MLENIYNPHAELLSELASIRKEILNLSEIVKTNFNTIQEVEILTDMPDRLKTKHLKKIFGISGVTIWNWENKRILQPQKVNGRKFYAKSDVLKLLNLKKTKHSL